MIRSPQIEVSSGHMSTIDAPFTTIETIAASLSKLCRFTGHCRHFYTVAEHSVLVSLLMEETDTGDPVEGLLHDAVETIVGDMASPWKPLFPDYVAAEMRADAHIREQFRLPSAKTAECATADALMGFVEAHLLMPSQGADWPDPHGLRKKAKLMIDQGWRTLNLYPQEAEAAFLRRWEELS